MKTKAVRIYGVNDLRIDEYELPAIKDDEILAKVVSDSICMSSHKLAAQGEGHKRIWHKPLAENPTIIGHEMCGELVEIGAKWKDTYKPGDRFTMQTALNYHGTLWAPGYSYPNVGGDATYIVIPQEVMSLGCLLEYHADNFYMGSHSEPISCIIGAYHAQYHTKAGSYEHQMGIKEGGSLVLLASAGPMGLGAIDYAIHNPRKPALCVVTDIDQARLDRAASILTADEAAKHGVKLVYVNTSTTADPVAALKDVNGGKLYDDVFCFAPVGAVVEQADALLGNDGCLNFFAGPNNPAFSATLNFYNVHYESHHLCGTSGGNTDDMKEALSMFAAGTMNPVALVTHIGGLNAVPESTVNLDKIPGGKKLIYTHKNIPLTAIDKFAEVGGGNGPYAGFFARLNDICAAHNGLWSKEAEDYLLKEAPDI
jgi:threonine dehydrogenase-like Zn-dependent dehydrogenase